MASGYEIEVAEPSVRRCEDCGELSVRRTGFVHRNDDAYAVYYAAYTNHHADHGLAMLVALGDWDDDADPADRAAFYCRVRPTEVAYEVMLGDAAESPWSDAKIIGRLLSRDAARAHPWRDAAFEVLDAALAQDLSLRSFLRRARCGDATIPLEMNFRSPDVIFALGDDGAPRVDLSRGVATLDGARFFVRCLLPIPVEHYGTWCVGVWVEVSKLDHDRVIEANGSPPSVERTRYSGAIANDLASELELPLALGSRVEWHFAEVHEPPRIAAPAEGDVAKLLSTPWSKSAFESYAVARGFL